MIDEDDDGRREIEILGKYSCYFIEMTKDAFYIEKSYQL